MKERPPIFRWCLRTACVVPCVRLLTRSATRGVINHAPLSRLNRQRVYNLVGPATVPASLLLVTARVPDGGTVRTELDLSEDMDRHWYY